MTYDEFKTHLITFLWKKGDTQLIASLDNLITMGDHELRRKVPITIREITETLPVDSIKFTMPAEFDSMVSLSDQQFGPYSNVTRATYDDKVAMTRNQQIWPFYTIQNGVVFLVGTFNPTTPTDVTFTYVRNIPVFQALYVCWLAEEYLDLYTYAVLKHSGPFLREDERVPLWKDLYGDAVASTIDDDNWNKKYGGSPLANRNVRTAP